MRFASGVTFMSSARSATTYLIPDNVEEEGLLRGGARFSYQYGPAAECPTGGVRARLSDGAGVCRRSPAAAWPPSRAWKSSAATFTTGTTRRRCSRWTALPFISSVDSGNMVASLYTLQRGRATLMQQPLFRRRLFAGMRAHLALAAQGRSLPAGDRRNMPLPDPKAAAGMDRVVPARRPRLPRHARHSPAQAHDGWWMAETLRRVEAISLCCRAICRGRCRSLSRCAHCLQLGSDERPTVLLRRALCICRGAGLRVWPAQARAVPSMPALRSLRSG